MTSRHTVTLITGDKVMVSGSGEQVEFQPRAGHPKVRSWFERVDGHLYVVPTDVMTLVASGRLDRRLFDVTGLIEAGYDDARSKSVPLIVTYAGVAGRTSVRSSGAETVRELPSINGTAVRVAKGERFSLMSGKQRLAAGVERVWLDGKRRTTLDVSVPRIGAPAAWQAGFTGKGVTVAVLDTGIDATHPDLDDRVTEAKNFTETPVGDQVGHGTHVASTIAGTDGKYRGVAPDAKLLDGKVCGDETCTESAIIAGMQWAAAEKKADVINLSLSGQDFPGIDPMEEAVNTLTAQTGSLFVIAAGNSGPLKESVGSPGSADAALTVGAVDKADEIADFSSRGPRVGDGGVKPDVTAPGVDIVAAKSKDAVIGDPVGDRHLRLSGTSMATPHVVGAAALLAQQHPDWTAAELKASLMSSAKPHASQGVFDQGTGRIDVRKAISSHVVVQPASLSFGLQRWPHNDDAPVTKQVTYRNPGTAPVDLELTAELTGPDGQSAPAGAIDLSDGMVTVPAGGSATVTVQVSTRHDGPDGVYAGRVTARNGDQSVSSVLSVHKEVESYDLTIKHLDTDGKLTGNAVSWLSRLDGELSQVAHDEDGTVVLRLPKGGYMLRGDVRTGSEDEGVDHLLVQPRLDLAADTTVEVDARRTKPLDITVENGSVRPSYAVVGYGRRLGDSTAIGWLLAPDLDDVASAQLGPAVPADEMVSYVSSHWAVPGPGGDFLNSPLYYGTHNAKEGAMFTGLRRAVKNSELAKVTVRHHAQVPGRRKVLTFSPLMDVPGPLDIAIGPYVHHDGGGTVTSYFEAGEARWSIALLDLVPRPGGGWDFAHDLNITELRSYRAGKPYAESLNAAVIGPHLPYPHSAMRYGDLVYPYVNMLADGAGNTHSDQVPRDSATTKLYRDGALVGESDQVGMIGRGVEVEPGDAQFRLEATVDRRTLSDLSTKVSAVWKFRSGTASEEGEALPLWVVRFRPRVDLDNHVKARRAILVPLEVRATPGAKVGKLKTPAIEVSGDDGGTWRAAGVVPSGRGTFLAVIEPPPGAKYLSLRAKAADSDGNTVEQTIIRAFGLR